MVPSPLREAVVFPFAVALILCGPGVSPRPADPASAEPPLVREVTRDLERHADSRPFAEAGAYHYPPVPPAIILPRPVTPTDPAAHAVEGGLLGAVSGAFLGYTILDRPGPDPCDPGFPCPGRYRFGADGSTVFTGAFLGWSVGSIVGFQVGPENPGDPATTVLASALVGAVAILVVNETDSPALYLPFAVLQVGAIRLLGSPR
jgi:hypothetical protein